MSVSVYGCMSADCRSLGDFCYVCYNAHALGGVHQDMLPGLADCLCHVVEGLYAADRELGQAEVLAKSCGSSVRGRK